jgi:hypothetical protein
MTAQRLGGNCQAEGGSGRTGSARVRGSGQQQAEPRPLGLAEQDPRAGVERRISRLLGVWSFIEWSVVS